MHSQERLYSAFHGADKNRSGTIEPVELPTALRKAGLLPDVNLELRGLVSESKISAIAARAAFAYQPCPSIDLCGGRAGKHSSIMPIFNALPPGMHVSGMGELDRLTDGQAHIFRAADDDKSGTIDWPEFLEIG